MLRSISIDNITYQKISYERGEREERGKKGVMVNKKIKIILVFVTHTQKRGRERGRGAGSQAVVLVSIVDLLFCIRKER